MTPPRTPQRLDEDNPHRRKGEMAISSLVAHPLWGFAQGIISILMAVLMGIAVWYLNGVNAKLAELSTTQTAEQFLRQKLEFEVAAVKERQAQSDQRGSSIRDAVSQLETFQKILEDRIKQNQETSRPRK